MKVTVKVVSPLAGAARRRLLKHLARIEPIAKRLREDYGIAEVEASMWASAVMHSQPADRIEGLRDLYPEVPDIVKELLRIRLEVDGQHPAVGRARTLGGT